MAALLHFLARRSLRIRRARLVRRWGRWSVAR